MLISAVRQGIADAVSAGVVTPVGGTTLLALAYVPDLVPDVPCLFVMPGDLTYDKTMGRGCDELMLTVTLYVSRVDDIAAQLALDAYTAGSGPSSVKAAIEAARGAPGQAALGGACDDLHVPSVRGYQWYLTAGDVRYLGAHWTVRVIGRGVI